MRYKLIRELPTLNGEYRIDDISSFEELNDVTIVSRFKLCLRKMSVSRTESEIRKHMTRGMFTGTYKTERWTLLDTLYTPRQSYGYRYSGYNSEEAYELELEKFKRFKREILINELIKQ